MSSTLTMYFLHNLNKFKISSSSFVIDKIIEFITLDPYSAFHSGIFFKRFMNSLYSLEDTFFNTDESSLISMETP